jgi:hypothetical protein
MANQYVALNVGQDGFKVSDFTIGTSSSASSDFEFRMANPAGTGAVPTRKAAVIALKAFIRTIESGAIFSNFPPL